MDLRIFERDVLRETTTLERDAGLEYSEREQKTPRGTVKPKK